MGNINPINIGNWWISNSESYLTKFQIPNGTIIHPRGTLAFYEGQFNTNQDTDKSFALNSSQGDKVILSATDSNGKLTGYRIPIEFEAAENGFSFGRIKTSLGDQFTSRALALLNDKLTVKLIYTIDRYIPDGCTEEDDECRIYKTTNIPLAELDAKTLNWSELL